MINNKIALSSDVKSSEGISF